MWILLKFDNADDATVLTNERNQTIYFNTEDDANMAGTTLSFRKVATFQPVKIEHKS